MARRIRSSSIKHPLFRRRWLLVSLLIVIAGGGYFAWNHYHHKAPASSPAAYTSGSKVTAAPPDNNAQRTPVSQNTATNQGGAVDKNGQSSSTPTDSSQWSTSTSGLLTLKTPVKNANFKSGDSIYGAASSGPVQFRLIDNQVGVIAQGSINVVNGNFSAVASFKAYGSGGRLDVFNTDSNGKEINEVQVPVSF